MTNKTLYILWGGMFSICAGLGFIPVFGGETGTALQAAMTALSVLFFLPPGVLLYRASRSKDRHTLALIRNLSALSLGLTLVLLVLNMLSAMRSEFLGNVLHGILIVVSSPMICSGYWVLSLFLWACLLMASLGILRGLSGK